MRAAFLRTVARHLRAPAGGGSTDADLLARFARGRDEAAFDELVRRHGPLVWGVCRRALANRADAEDAFQATFLVLARNPRAVRKPAALGCWLYGVARRVAVRTRGRLPLTAADGGAAVPDPRPPAVDRLTVREFLTALDDELGRLPDKLRGPLVLCFLQERTHTEAARLLGLSLSTLKRRLDAGRATLRDRLARRGVDLSAVLAAATLAGVAGTAPSATVVDATIRAATGGAVSVNVITITEGVLRVMGHTKLKAWAAVVLMATVVGGTGYVAVAGGQTGGPGPGQVAVDGAKKPEPAKDGPPTAIPAPAGAGATPDLKMLELEVKLAESESHGASAALQAYLQQVALLAKATGAGRIAEFEQKGMEATMARQRRDAEVAAIKLEMARHRFAVAKGEAKPAAAMSLESRELRVRALAAAKEAARLDYQMRESGAAGGVGPESAGLATTTFLHRSRRMFDLESSLGERYQAAVNHLSRLRVFEDYIFNRARAGAARLQDALDVKTARLEAEAWVKEAEAASPNPPKPPPAGPTPPALPAGFYGKVQSYDSTSGLVTLTPGLEAGVQKGAVVTVLRYTDGGKYLGKVTILSADPKTSVGRFIPANPRAVGPNDSPQTGDEVRVSEW